MVTMFAGGIAAKRARNPARDPRTLLVTTTEGVEPATVLKARFSLKFGAAVAACFAVVFGGAGLTSEGAEAVFFPITIYLAGAAFYLGSGRIGDRSIVFTRERIRQRAGALEQSVRWEDVTIITGNTQGLDLWASAVDVRRISPWFYTGRGVRTNGAMRLQLADVPWSIAVVDSLQTWRDEPWRRTEIGTDEAVARLIRPS
jgi:hypothetical protein